MYNTHIHLYLGQWTWLTWHSVSAGWPLYHCHTTIFVPVKSLLSPCPAGGSPCPAGGYSNASVVPSVCASVRHTLTLWTRYRLNRWVHFHQTSYTCCPWWEDEPYWFSRSEVKGQGHMDKNGHNLVSTIETKPLSVFSSNLIHILPMMRGWTLLIFKIRGQRSRSQWTNMEITLWTRLRRNRLVYFHQT